MNLPSFLANILKKEPEPDFSSIEFIRFEDSLQNFSILYPKHWRVEDTTALIDGAYNILFYSKKSDTSLCINIEMQLPNSFTTKAFMKRAKDEIEKPSAGILSKSHKGMFKGCPCVATQYVFSKDNERFHGQKTIFYTGDRIFSLLFLCPLSKYDKLKNTIEYVKESIVIKPRQQ